MSELVATSQQGLVGKYQPYQEYKDSGVEWLKLSPSSWETKALKYIVSCNDEVLSESTDPDMEFEYIDIGGVSSSEGITRTETMTFSRAPSRARRVVKDGDIIVSTVRTYLEAIAPISSEFDGRIASTGFAVLRPKFLLSSFARYALRARHFIDSVVARSTGVSYPAINSSELINIKIVVPSWEEQQVIADFLDYEIARIDRLIAQQKRLIELLKEKRQAVISHAVTKGLNPNAPMKNSGIEWLGQVPEHWIYNFKLGAVAEQNRGSFVNGPFGSDLLSNELTQEGVPVIYIRDVKPSGYYRKSTDCVTHKKAKQLNVCKVEPGDVLVAKVGSPPGDACIYPNSEPEAIITQDVVRIRVNKQLCDAYYLSCLLNSTYGKAIVDDISVESTRKRFGLGDYKQLKIPLPPLDEQIQLASWIRDQCDKLDMLNTKAKCTIDLMQERRTALISAVVTGKIDLRGWTPPSDNEVTA